MAINKENEKCNQCGGETKSLAGTGKARYCPTCESTGKTTAQWERELAERMMGIKPSNDPNQGGDLADFDLDLDNEKTDPLFKGFAPCQQTFFTFDNTLNLAIPCGGCKDCMYKSTPWSSFWSSKCVGGWRENTVKNIWIKCPGCAQTYGYYGLRTCPSLPANTPKELYERMIDFGVVNTNECDGAGVFTSSSGRRINPTKPHICKKCSSKP